MVLALLAPHSQAETLAGFEDRVYCKAVEESMRFADCPHCQGRVQVREVACYEREGDEDDSWPPYRMKTYACTVCEHALVYLEVETIGDGPEWDDEGRPFWPRRVYPPDEPSQRRWADAIPETVRHSLEEATKSIEGGAYEACAVMTGRAIEAICRHFQTQQVTLGPGLRELRDRGIIDSRLCEWAHELHQRRNAAAHPSGEQVDAETAQDLLDFTCAICEYVFVLQEKWDRFLERKRPNNVVDNGTVQ